MANDVFVPQSTTTYSTLNAANAGEAGIDYGVPTEFVLDGTSAGADVTFSDANYVSSIAIKAASGQETTGDISVGAQTTTNIITSSVSGMTVDDIRSRRFNLDTGNFNAEFNNVVGDGNGTLDVFGFRSAGTPAQNFTNCLAHNCSEGWRATATNDNAIATNCTVTNHSGFGFLRPRAVDTVATGTGTCYFQQGASSSNYWDDDGTGSNTITESPVTDIFVDYAGGDYRILSSSSVGAAGAGAFIQTATGGVTADIDFDVTKPEFSVEGAATLPQPIAEIDFDVTKPEFSVDGSATLPQPIAEIDFDIPSPTFSVDGSATLPQPIGDVDFTIPAPLFSVDGSATVPNPSAEIDFIIPSPTFSVDGTATQPQPTAEIDFDIPAPLFSVEGSATIPEIEANIDFEIPAPLFNVEGSATIPQVIADIDFDIPKPIFSISGAATLPQPIAEVDFEITKPEFSVSGTVSGLVITPSFDSVLVVDYKSNIIII